MKAATYLLFKNNAREAIQAYKNVFGAEVVRQHHYEEGMTENPALLGKVFHAELIIGDLNLYLCDTAQEPAFKSIKFVVEISDEKEARAQLAKMSKYGKIIHDFTKMPYGPTIAQAQDQFGIKWEFVIC